MASATVETKVDETFLSVMANLVVRSIEPAMKSAGITPAPFPSCYVLDTTQRDFSGDTNGLQVTASKHLTQRRA